MCGRYTLTATRHDLQALLPGVAIPEDLAPRYNIAPTQAAPVVTNDAPDRMQLLHWGLLPPWAKEPSLASRLINARAETLTEKPSFRAPFRRRRCLVLTDGFYEWKAERGGRVKIPLHVRLVSRAPFTLAGLWESWRAPDGEKRKTFTIITTSANETVSAFHDRMPVILSPADRATWLAPGELTAEALTPLLVPHAGEALEAVAVSTFVNSVKNDGPACLEPAS